MLNADADPQEILRRAISAGARINRFELVEPSLNDIFIESVTKRESKPDVQSVTAEDRE